jgi:hypothetical protein
MMPDSTHAHGIDRRGFLKLAGLSASAIAAPGVMLAEASSAQAVTATPYYLNCYFPNTNEHGMNYALSTDGYHFTSYKGNPFMTDTVGTGDKLLRDPHIIREVANPGQFHLVATYSWADRPMVAWDSNTLFSWANGRLVYPSDVTMKQTWAPQFEYDAATGKYFVYWTGCINNVWSTACIRYMTTTDFQTWSAPQTLFSSSVPVMDASIFRANGKFHLLYRGTSGYTYQVTSSGSILGPYNVNDHVAVAWDREGPFAYQLYGQNVWLMIADIYGPGGPYQMARSTDGVTWTVLASTDFSFPSGAADKVRHGSVIPITADEYAQLSGQNLLTNPGFESGFTGWTVTSPNGTTAAHHIENNAGNSHTGTHNLATWSTGAAQAYTSQTRTGLMNGTYTARAWVKSGGGQTTAQLEAKNYGGTLKATAIPTSSTYTQITISGIAVTNGQCTIGVWVVAAAGQWVNVDDVEFFKQ